MIRTSLSGQVKWTDTEMYLRLIIKVLNKALLTCALPISVIGCCGPKDPTPDINYLADFHRAYFSSQEDVIEEGNLALYVDYSTCIADAMQTMTMSKFYMDIVPSLTNAAKQYFSIKGNQIKEENGVDMYSLLRSVSEVNYADLRTAVNMIADGNTEAILLTDGEYYEQSIAKSHVNDPYMAPALEKWLTRGHDVYIFSEPYVEIHKGHQYNKKRFYFLFTDSRLHDNIFSKIEKNVKIEDYPDVRYYHLTANNPSLQINRETAKFGDCATPNELLMCRPEAYGNFEIEDWSNMDWKSIKKYIFNAYDQITGEALPDGDMVITGLALDKNFQGGCYRIEDIDLKVYGLNQAYKDFVNNLSDSDTGETVPVNKVVQEHPLSLSPAPNFMKLDKKEFAEQGLINIYFDTQMFDPTILYDGDPWSYFKLDITVKDYSDNFSHNPMAEDIFTFDSIDMPGNSNISIVESIKQVVSKPAVSNMVKGKTIYSIYVRTNKY